MKNSAPTRIHSESSHAAAAVAAPAGFASSNGSRLLLDNALPQI
jgi:hypothetical protein